MTILLAVLTPVFTLIGIFWTQRTADRRAERDAALRLQNQRATDEEARLIEVYREVNAAKPGRSRPSLSVAMEKSPLMARCRSPLVAR